MQKDIAPFIVTNVWFIGGRKTNCKKCFDILWVDEDFLSDANEGQVKSFLKWFRQSMFYGIQNRILVHQKYIAENPDNIFICEVCQSQFNLPKK